MINPSHILLIFLALSLNSCKNNKQDSSLFPFDKDTGLSKKQIKDHLTSSEVRSQKTEEKEKANKTPKIAPILATPEPPKLADGKLVSITITEDIPLKDVLVELGRIAEIELEIDPQIEGGIILIAKDRPFIDVVSQISDLANLRYTINNGILRVERDIPYMVNYPLDFLDIVRNYTSSLEVSTSSGGDSVTAGGSSSISASSDGDLWSNIISDIERFISSEEGSSGSYVTSNKKASLLSVSANSKAHKIISEYLEQVRKSSTAQVLIEAKIVEVTLDDTFQSGINWSEVNAINASGAFTENLNSTDFFSIVISDDAGGNNDDLTGTLQMIESFGTTRTLSSPRITAINNQQAVLSFTTERVYFEVDYETSTTTSTTGPNQEQSVSSTINTVPVGIVLTLQPAINLETQEVVMSIRPTISSVSNEVQDPAVTLAAQIAESSTNIQSTIPELQLREIDTFLKAKSGQVMVIGGLIEQRKNVSESGVPFIKNIPFLGTFFKSKIDSEDITETVIFIKATIVNTDDPVDDVDKNFYKSFTTDPRSFSF